MLFDLRTDPGEAYNLAQRYPDQVIRSANSFPATRA